MKSGRRKDVITKKLGNRPRKENGRRTMTLECPKCGNLYHYSGAWHPDLGQLICGDCLGINDLAEEASYRHEEDDEEE